MNPLLRLSGDLYRQEYIAGNIASHILQGIITIAQDFAAQYPENENPSRN